MAPYANLLLHSFDTDNDKRKEMILVFRLWCLVLFYHEITHVLSAAGHPLGEHAGLQGLVEVLAEGDGLGQCYWYSIKAYYGSLTRLEITSFGFGPASP